MNGRSAFVHRPFSGALHDRWFLRKGARAKLTWSDLSWQQPPIRIRGVSFPATTASRPYHSRNLWPQSLTPALVQYGTLILRCVHTTHSERCRTTVEFGISKEAKEPQCIQTVLFPSRCRSAVYLLGERDFNILRQGPYSTELSVCTVHW